MYVVMLVLFLFSKTAQKKEEVYLSPWSSIKKASPKIIIDFDGTGHPAFKTEPNNKFYSYKEYFGYIKRNKKNNYVRRDDDDNLWNSTYVMEGIQNFIRNHLRPEKRLKALTYCKNELQICRFLFCPNIKKNCILCEVHTKNNNKNSTTCETFNTSFLIDHGLFERGSNKRFNVHLN